jgi:meso-butanediol dehydrogenase / (S,S)-butanediol dehydrogenase / diacetyl reductase
MEIRLDEKTAVVTGAGTGIGRGIAMQLAQCGADIAVVDVNETSAQSTAEAIRGLGQKSLAVCTDVSSSTQVIVMVEKVLEVFGKIDILCNNAGISQVIKLVDMTEEDWDRMLDINIKGVFLCSKYIVPHMIAQGGGRIINTASYLGKMGVRELSHYCASKFAVIGFTQSLAHELAPQGILVNAVGPGDVDTEMMAREWVWEAQTLGVTPEEAKQRCINKQMLGRLEKPADIAGMVAFLASDYASYISGETYNVSGGLPLTA